MAARTPIIAALVLLVAGYVAYPCLTLYRLDSAMARGDAVALRRLVDWPQVRRGIEADLAENGGQDLAPFGTAFLRTVAVKASVTPETVLTALRATSGHAGDNPMGAAWLRAAWPEGPGRVVLDFGTVRLRLELCGGNWQVTRAWLPADVLTQTRAGARNPRRG